MPVESRKSQASAPAAASIESFSVLVGKARSGWRVNSPVMVWCVLTTACEVPGSRRASASALGAHDQVAAQQQVGAAGAQPHGVQRLGRGADADMADDRAALLRHAELVEHGDALAFDMRRHAHDGADGDDAGAADAGDQHAVGPVGDRRQRRGGRQRRLDGRPRRLSCVGLALADAAAFDRDEARAEAVEAGEVLVAGRLVDGALVAELGLDRHDAEAVRLGRAVAAALAHRLVDEHALGGIGVGAALAAAALLGGAGLVVDQDRDALATRAGSRWTSSSSSR